MGTIANLLDSLSPDPLQRWRQFEHVCRWYLLNDPTYKLIVKRVWLWDEWPKRWGRDAGIDLVAETKTGELWAIQSKCVASDHYVRKEEIDSFLSESSRATFSFRLLIATTDHLGPNARRTLLDQEKLVHPLLLSALEAAEVDWPTSPADLKPRPTERKKPFPHNNAALQEILQGLQTHARGQVVMACGTGKTLVSLWTAEALGSNRTLVLVPSLSLLSQTIREWTLNASGEFAFLPVCSDETVADDDAIVGHTSELGFPVTTDPKDIAAFQSQTGRRVIFSTYQSSPRIAQAFTGNVPAFDLVIADESHRCAGAPSAPFATVLDEDQIKATKRLFLTATPRYLSPRAKAGGEIGDSLRLISMDDPELFGPVLHRLTFRQAIAQDLLADYQVVVVAIDDPTYADFVERGTLVQPQGAPTTDARTLATQIAVLKSIRKHNLGRVLTFHGRVRAAQQFVASLPTALALVPTEEAPTAKIWATPVSGAMPTGERDILLRRFRDRTEDEVHLVANVRCLSEGVDIPSIDGLVFIDPRRSHIDIVQAVGRVLRTSPGKTRGTVLIPVFIEPGDDAEQKVSTSPFAGIWSVLLALRAHDESLAEELDGIRRSLGRRGGSGVVGLPSKIVLDVPSSIGKEFGEALSLQVIERTTRAFEFYLGLLQRYVEENDGAASIRTDTAEFGYPQLGQFVTQQRMIYNNGEVQPNGDRAHHRYGILTTERMAQLEAIKGWQWAPLEDYFERGTATLLAYVGGHGDANVGIDVRFNDFPLGRWVGWNRTAYKNGSLSEERVQRLGQVPGWQWDPQTENWDAAYKILTEFVKRGGNPDVGARFEDAGFALGLWISRQRGLRRRGRLAKAREARLEAVRGWTWDEEARGASANTSPKVHARSAARWDRAYDELKKYLLENGPSIPTTYRENGFGLGNWVGIQRKDYKKGLLSSERIKRLEEIPNWRWVATAEVWDRNYEALRAYAAREGTTKMTTKQIEDGIHLARWIENQKKYHRQGTLDPMRRDRLESIPEWRW